MPTSQPVAKADEVLAWRWRSDPPTPYKTRTVADLRGFGAPDQIDRVPLSRFGGRLDRRVADPGPGFFRVHQGEDRWWLVDPEGYLMLNVGMNSLSPGNSPQLKEALAEKFKTDSAWADHAAGLMRDLGFNSAGAWSADDLLIEATPRIAYTPTWNFMSRYGKKRGGTFAEMGHTGYPNRCIFVFEPEFETFSDEYARQLAQTKDDPYLLGHFTDNELPFPDDVLDRYLQLPPDDAGHKAAAEWLTARRGSADPAQITFSDREEFRAHVIDRYLTIVCGAIRKYDPNHMILGPRFYGDEKKSDDAFEVIGRHLDVIAVNLYHVWTPDEQVRQWGRWAGKPLILTEWYAKGMDSGLPNITGAGWTVYTQEDRGRFYQNFAIGLLETDVCVGWHWFKYADNDPTDPKAEMSNKDSNKGMVRTNYEPYEPLAERMRELNRCVYPLADYFDARGRPQQ